MKSWARFRGWALYALGWIPLALVYSALIAQSRGLRFTSALRYGVQYVVPAALLSAGVWWLSGQRAGRRRNLALTLGEHALLALAYAALWHGFIVSMIALNTGFVLALRISRSFAGWQLFSGVLLYVYSAGIAQTLRMGRRLREQEAIAARAESLRMRAELESLRGRLNPHFLFNTLHTLTALVRRDPATAERALEQFGEMLRYVLDVKRAAREDVTLAEELDFVRNYLALEQLRFGDRLRVAESVDPDTLDCVVPSLTLQPLVENAIKYGVAPRSRGATIEIASRLEGQELVAEILDDGPGAAAESRSGGGVGLRAVRQRLETRYPGQGQLTVATAPDRGFRVLVRIPAHTAALPLADAARAAR